MTHTHIQRNILLAILWGLYVISFTVLFPLTSIAPNQFIPYATTLTPVTLVLFFLCLIGSACIVYHLPRYLQGITVKSALLLVTVFSIPFFLSYPGDSYDVFVNMWQAERVITYHENPYASILDTSNYPTHEFLPDIQQYVHLPYGPIWLALQIGLYSLVSNTSILVATIFFKSVFLVLWLLFSYLLLTITARTNSHILKELTTLLISPLPLAGIMGNMHNDLILLIFWLGIYVCLVRRKHALTILLFLLNIFTKFIAIIILPLLLLFYLLTAGRSRFLICGVLLGLTVVGIGLAEWQLGFLHGLVDQTSTFGGSIIFAASFFFSDSIVLALRSVYFAVFAIVYSIVLRHVYVTYKDNCLNETRLLQWAGFVMTIAIILLVHFFGYHYLVWPIPFLILYKDPKLLRFYAFASSIVLTVMLMTFIIYDNSYGVRYSQVYLFNAINVHTAYLLLFLLSHILITSLVLYTGYRMYRYLTTNENLTS